MGLNTFEKAVRTILSKCLVDNDGCWIFTGGINRYGYGKVNIAFKTFKTHRVMFQYFNPGVAAPMLDHVCHDPKTCPGGNACKHRRCANPAHLVVSSHKENNSKERSHGVENAARLRRARTHCKHGHEFTPENTRIDSRPDGICRICKQCNRDNALAFYYSSRVKPSPAAGRG